MDELVYEGRTIDQADILAAESVLNEGDKGQFVFYTDGVLTDGQVSRLTQEIISQGVILTGPITQESGIIVVPFQKALAPLLIIGLAVGGVLLLGTGLIGWQVFRSVQQGVPLWVWAVGAGALLYLVFTSEPAKTTGRFAVKAGKVYALKKVPEIGDYFG